MLPRMFIETISLEQVDFEDERLRITESLEQTALLDSLREVGQVNPVLLMAREGRRAIVCGFRRIWALRQLGQDRIFARILPPETNPAQAFLTALWDNLSHRRLDPLEKARVLFTLKNSFDVPEETLIRSYLPILEINPAAGLLHGYLRLHESHPLLRRCMVDGLLTQASVFRIIEMPFATQESLSNLMRRIRLSASLQRKFLDLLTDLAAGRDLPLEAPLATPDSAVIIEDPRLSPVEKGERLFGHLHRLRNPRLSQALDRFAAAKAKLGLPGAIQIDAHPFFEEPGIRIEFHAPDIERLRRLSEKLHEASATPEFERLFDLE